jgi:hypothetical protein
LPLQGRPTAGLSATRQWQPRATHRKEIDMTRLHRPAQADKRLEGKAHKPDEKLPTYQELVDEALDETFPASDPISPTAATRPRDRISTSMDDKDWKLSPEGGSHGMERVVAQFADEAQGRRVRDELLSTGVPSVRLDLPAPGTAGAPAATLIVPVESIAQARQVREIAQRGGASTVA